MASDTYLHQIEDVADRRSKSVPATNEFFFTPCVLPRDSRLTPFTAGHTSERSAPISGNACNTSETQWRASGKRITKRIAFARVHHPRPVLKTSVFRPLLGRLRRPKRLHVRGTNLSRPRGVAEMIKMFGRGARRGERWKRTSEARRGERNKEGEKESEATLGRIDLFLGMASNLFAARR